MYVRLDSDNRVVDMLNEDIDDRPDLDEDGKAWLHGEFPVRVENPGYVMSVAVHDGRDIVVEGGIARYDPLPESREKVAEEFRAVVRQAKIDGIIEAVGQMGLAALSEERG